MPPSSIRRHFGILALVSSHLCATTSEGVPINVIKAPANSLVPDVALDKSGVLHMVYGTTDHQGYYTQSRDNGGTWTTAVKLNDNRNVTTTMGERGPKIALGSDGVIHVAWMDFWYEGAQTFARYVRSTDGGASFSAPIAASDHYGVDGVIVVADSIQNVYVFWHGLALNETAPANATSVTWLYQARSTTNGASFSFPSTHTVIPGMPYNNGEACSMCAMRARIASDGSLLLALRTGIDNIRQFFLLRSTSQAAQFSYVPITSEAWPINSCPMNGPELEIGPDGSIYAAIMTNDNNNVFWASSSANGTIAFNGPFATPQQRANERYPTAVPDGQGNVLFVWQVGPMSVSGTATVHYAVYSESGVYTGQSAVLGVTTSGTKATAFAAPPPGSPSGPAQFYIVTTAS